MRELIARGQAVRAVSRSSQRDFPQGVEIVKGDITNPEDAKRVCKGAEVIYNCAQRALSALDGDVP